MCGIFVVINKDKDVSVDLLYKMQDMLYHRGPDGKGSYVYRNVGLAHTRLSIIDIAGGAQPLYSHDENIILIANGEIYNDLELRDQLIGEGYVFQTGSDCEVIIPLYEKYGKNCVNHLNGMFAFALYDKNTNEIFLARDRMGEKPLYLYRDNEKVIFSSEIRNILLSGEVEPLINHLAILDYFKYQFVPDPDTVIANIKRVPAATTIKVNCHNLELEKSTYWDLLDAKPIESDPVTTIKEVLQNSVKSTLRADVPVGLSLSGGIDSSAIACIANQYYPGNLQAISIGYKNAENVDERNEARALAKALSIGYYEVEIDDCDMINDFSNMVYCRDEPIGDITGYNYLKIMEKAHNSNIPVMLQGHGIDELCWGYPWVKKTVHDNENIVETIKNIYRTSETRNGRFKKINSIIKNINSDSFNFRNSRYVKLFELNIHTKYLIKNIEGIFGEKYKDIDISKYISMGMPRYNKNYFTTRSDLEVTRNICTTYLRNNGISQGDKLSMAKSVEMRLPFVDYSLVETIIGLRKNYRDENLPEKYYLKQALKDIVPQEILNRPKRGFSPPATRWQQKIRQKYGHLLNNGILVKNNIITKDAAERLGRPDISNGSEAVMSRLAIILELWFRELTDRGVVFN